MRGLFYILLLSFSPCVYRFANLRPVSRICQWLPNSKSLVCVNLSPKEHRRLKAGNLEAIEKTYSKQTPLTLTARFDLHQAPLACGSKLCFVPAALTF